MNGSQLGIWFHTSSLWGLQVVMGKGSDGLVWGGVERVKRFGRLAKLWGR